MHVHIFLARPPELQRFLDSGTTPPPGLPLTGVDPVNLASLMEIVTGGSLSTDSATPAIEEAVLSAGPGGPSIHQVPDEAVEALGNADAAERARWLNDWAGGNHQPGDEPERALEALATLAGRRAAEQGLYLWVMNEL
jgi:hypothetical protein